MEELTYQRIETAGVKVLCCCTFGWLQYMFLDGLLSNICIELQEIMLAQCYSKPLPSHTLQSMIFHQIQFRYETTQLLCYYRPLP